MIIDLFIQFYGTNAYLCQLLLIKDYDHSNCSKQQLNSCCKLNRSLNGILNSIILVFIINDSMQNVIKWNYLNVCNIIYNLVLLFFVAICNFRFYNIALFSKTNSSNMVSIFTTNFVANYINGCNLIYLLVYNYIGYFSLHMK